MSESVVNNLAIGALGSIIGALVVYLTSLLGRGAWTISGRTRRFQRELEIWRGGKTAARRGITNEYIFATLRWLFLGNLLWLVPEIIGPFTWHSLSAERAHLYVNTVALVFGLFSFLVGLGIILRYLRLRRSHDPLRLQEDA